MIKNIKIIRTYQFNQKDLDDLVLTIENHFKKIPDKDNIKKYIYNDNLIQQLIYYYITCYPIHYLHMIKWDIQDLNECVKYVQSKLIPC